MPIPAVSFQGCSPFRLELFVGNSDRRQDIQLDRTARYAELGFSPSGPLFMNSLNCSSSLALVEYLAALWLHDAMNLIGGQIFQHLARAARPAHFELLHGLEWTQTEVRARVS